MKEIKIIENFLKDEDFINLQSFLMGGNISWHYNDDVLEPGTNKFTDHFQFTHMFFTHSTPMENFKYMYPLIQKINPLALLKIKANLLTRDSTNVEHGMHTDFYNEPRVTTAVFYINTNNGYTLFENGEKVFSRANRIAIFPSNMVHTGSACTDEKIRVVINLNYIEKNNEI